MAKTLHVGPMQAIPSGQDRSILPARARQKHSVSLEPGYKWVSVNMLVVTCDGLASHPGRVAILL